MNAFLSLVAAVVLVYVFFGALLFFGQRSILYHPTPVIEHGFEEEIFTTEVDVRVIVLNSGLGKAILYFGGNADSMALNAPEMFSALPSLSVYLVNYRGYGGSGGVPTEAGLYSDALLIFDELARRHELVHVMGRSLGSGVATYVASERDVSKLVLITPFDSVVRVARGHYPIYPAGLMVRDRHDSIDRAARIQSETLLLVAEQDRVIPKAHSLKLADALSHVSPRLHVLDGVSHNTISLHKRYYPLIRDFF